MITITLGNITITTLNKSSGLFYGDKNTHKNFRHHHIVNEVVGTVSGNNNVVRENQWVKNNENWEENKE